MNRPQIDVITSPGGDHLIITRGDRKSCTSHPLRGDSERERIINIVTDLLGDRKMAEHLP